MDTLKATFGLSYPDLVKVQVAAYNDYGWGATSPVNTVGATIQDVPLAMTVPSRGSYTTVS